MATDWELISKVRASKYREKVLLALDSVKTPTALKKELDIDKAHVTRGLQSLVSMKLVEDLTPNVRKHKLFRRTSSGDSIVKNISKL